MACTNSSDSPSFHTCLRDVYQPHGTSSPVLLHSLTDSMLDPKPAPQRIMVITVRAAPPTIARKHAHVPIPLACVSVSCSRLPVVVRVSKRFNAAAQFALYGMLELFPDDADVRTARLAGSRDHTSAGSLPVRTRRVSCTRAGAGAPLNDDGVDDTVFRHRAAYPWRRERTRPHAARTPCPMHSSTIFSPHLHAHVSRISRNPANCQGERKPVGSHAVDDLHSDRHFASTCFLPALTGNLSRGGELNPGPIVFLLSLSSLRHYVFICSPQR